MRRAMEYGLPVWLPHSTYMYMRSQRILRAWLDPLHTRMAFLYYRPIRRSRDRACRCVGVRGGGHVIGLVAARLRGGGGGGGGGEGGEGGGGGDAVRVLAGCVERAAAAAEAARRAGAAAAALSRAEAEVRLPARAWRYAFPYARPLDLCICRPRGRRSGRARGHSRARTRRCVRAPRARGCSPGYRCARLPACAPDSVFHIRMQAPGVAEVLRGVAGAARALVRAEVCRCA